MGFNKKDKVIFWYGAGLGIGGGILGNLWVAVFIDLLLKNANWATWPLFIFFSLGIFWLLWKINTNLKKLK